MNEYHKPVMVREIVEFLTLGNSRGGILVDATLGGGGHAEALLRSRSDVCVIGMDQDEEAIRAASARLADFGDRFRAIHSNFRRISERVEEASVEGVLMDLGVSSRQLGAAERGFSFQQDGPLDMRMDAGRGLTAQQMVNSWKEEELARIFWELGEERYSRRIARRIVEERKRHVLRTTRELAEIVARAIPGGRRDRRIHPATRTFQALRMAVNDELGSLDEGLDGAWRCLREGGRMAVISFHSLEDRIVKNKMRRWAREERTGELLVRKPMEPGEEEIQSNPRSRSAKLRVIQKLKI